MSVNLYALTYGTHPDKMSLTDLHRAVTHLQRQQRIVWLAHRHRRIARLLTARRDRMRTIALMRAHPPETRWLP